MDVFTILIVIIFVVSANFMGVFFLYKFLPKEKSTGKLSQASAHDRFSIRAVAPLLDQCLLLGLSLAMLVWSLVPSDYYEEFKDENLIAGLFILTLGLMSFFIRFLGDKISE